MNQLLEIIAAEIRKRGAISFEQFMRLALYCPLYGYYEKEEDTISRNGDFYTSVNVGNLFGELLAFQFAEWLAECKSETRPVQIVEAGAHRGHLAKDILTWFRQYRPELFQSLQYVILEPSAARQKWQSETLANFGNKITWSSGMTLATRISGIIFSNELLDAMPVRRFGWNAQKKSWYEWGVTLVNGKLAWTGLDSQNSWNPGYLPIEQSNELLAVLPNGFIFEKCDEAEAWWRNAACALERGKLMTIDYGLSADELISPERINGTLRAYHRHHVTADLLADPGEQDLTAHVNFGALIAAGEASGLKTEKFDTQAQFLTRIFAQAWEGESVGQPGVVRARELQTLIHPEHLGHSFRVLVQTR